MRPARVLVARAPARGVMVSCVADARGLSERLTPSFIAVKQPSGWDSQVFLTLELLAARTMFPDALDPALLPALP